VCSKENYSIQTKKQQRLACKSLLFDLYISPNKNIGKQIEFLTFLAFNQSSIK